jgi:hypothetical protein
MFLTLGEHKMPRGEERVVLELHPDSGTRTFPVLELLLILLPGLGIGDILVRIRIQSPGSVHLTNGSGSGSDFRFDSFLL